MSAIKEKNRTGWMDNNREKILALYRVYKDNLTYNLTFV